MKTYFASPERTNDQTLKHEIDLASQNPIMTALLHSLCGMIAILDKNRQVIALNDAFLHELGINDVSKVLGLRLGEVLDCVHAHEEPAGCGTTKFCSTCGAAIAIASSLGQKKQTERICALTTNHGANPADISFLVNAHPLRVDKQKYVMLFMRDITLQQQRAALERTFFHDIKNLLCGLVGACSMANRNGLNPRATEIIQLASTRLDKEIEIQRCLMSSDSFDYQPYWENVTCSDILKELKTFYKNHPLTKNKTVEVKLNGSNQSIKTDTTLLLRVLYNMVSNALEATKDDGKVKVWVNDCHNVCVFNVWNHGVIPHDVTLRIFQRNFSTKSGDGRGVGTFSMKLFGEKILGGVVGFTSSFMEGTVFRLSLPTEF